MSRFRSLLVGCALVAMAGSSAVAQAAGSVRSHDVRQDAAHRQNGVHSELRQERREMAGERRELRQDRVVTRGDVEQLRAARATGDAAGVRAERKELRHDKSERVGDKREIRQGRRERRADVRQLRRDTARH